MVRSRLILTIVSVLCASSAAAQPLPISGFLTGSIGVAHGGDIESPGVSPAAAMAIVESNGWGAEIDLGYSHQFNDELFSESGITTFMIGPIWIRPDFRRVRPTGQVGVGLLRARGETGPGIVIVSRTDWGMNAGGGLLIMVNDAIGLRGDVRYFRYFQRHDDLPLTDKGFFDFWRVSIGATWSWPVR